METSPPSPAEPPGRTRGRAALALALIVPAPTVAVWAAMVQFPGPVGAAIFAVCKAWMLGLPLVWLLFVERARPGLSPARHGGFGVGAILGVAMAAAIFAGYYVFGRHWIDAEHVREEAIENGIGTRVAFLGAAAYWILVNSVLEEYVYRWFVFRKCEQLMPAALAVGVSGAFFTIHHVLALRLQFDWNVTSLASAGIFVGGAVWSWMYLKYRSIWPGYLSHAIVDIAVFTLGWRIIFAS